MVVKRSYNTPIEFLILALCVVGFVGSAQPRGECVAWVEPRSFDMHIIFGIHAGSAIMLAPFEYNVSRPELRQPASRPAFSFYNAFAGIEFEGNELLFSYGDLPMACGYVIYDPKKNLHTMATGW